MMTMHYAAKQVEPTQETHLTHTHTHTLLTIAFAKDVLGRLAQVCVGGRDSHDAINRKKPERHLNA